MRRLYTSFALGLFALLILAAPAAGAARVWCARDPIVTIDGTTVQIWVAVPDEYAAFVNDAVEVRINTPKDLDREVIFLDEGFNGHGEKVKWGNLVDHDPNDGVTPVDVQVRVKFDKKQMERTIGKDQLVADLGKKMDVPVMVTVNIGELTEDYDTQVLYGTHKKTEFSLTVSSAADID